MALIEWTDELSVGIESIDVQHKKLVNMINALNDAILSGEPSKLLIQIFNNLTTYTHVHFTYEERMFAEFGYPASEAHQKQHKALIAQLVDLKQKFNDDPKGTISADLMLFLKKWLTNHIMRTDKEYTEFLLAKGVE